MAVSVTEAPKMIWVFACGVGMATIGLTVTEVVAVEVQLLVFLTVIV